MTDSHLKVVVPVMMPVPIALLTLAFVCSQSEGFHHVLPVSLRPAAKLKRLMKITVLQGGWESFVGVPLQVVAKHRWFLVGWCPLLGWGCFGQVAVAWLHWLFPCIRSCVSFLAVISIDFWFFLQDHPDRNACLRFSDVVFQLAPLPTTFPLVLIVIRSRRGRC